MQKRMLFCVQIVIMITLLLFVACKKKPESVLGEWGEPKYGGTINLRTEIVDVITDPQDPRSTQFGMWMEALFGDNMLIDRKEFAFQTTFVPLKYQQPWMAEGYEITDPTTITVKIRKGIKWQNKPPVNGRDFTADDVVYSYNRILGKDPFKTPNPFFMNFFPNIESVNKIDDYTVQFKLNAAHPMAIYQITRPMMIFGMVAKEWVALGPPDTGPGPGGPPKGPGGPPKGKGGPPPGPAQVTPLTDWHNVVGTGPYILTDFVYNISITGTRNPDYWGYDERFPDNKLPYADTMRVVCIPDMAPAIAAMRTGKIDLIADGRSHPSIPEALALEKSNPDIKQVFWPGGTPGVTFKYNTKPFDDVRVRKAMQMAIDAKTIAETYYKGFANPTPVGIASPALGEEWSVPYEDWPKSLQEEYSYNPEKAKALLKEAGYPKGFTVEVQATPVDDPELLQILKSQFNHIGVNMEIRAADMMTHRNLVNKGQYKHMYYQGYFGRRNNPGDILTDFYSKKLERAGMVNDPTYDAMVEKYNKAESLAEAQKIFKEADKYVLEQHWTTQVCASQSPQVHQPWLKGWSGEQFWSIWTWAYYPRMWIDPDLKK